MVCINTPYIQYTDYSVNIIIYIHIHSKDEFWSFAKPRPCGSVGFAPGLVVLILAEVAHSLLYCLVSGTHGDTMEQLLFLFSFPFKMEKMKRTIHGELLCTIFINLLILKKDGLQFSKSFQRCWSTPKSSSMMLGYVYCIRSKHNFPVKQK